MRNAVTTTQAGLGVTLTRLPSQADPTGAASAPPAAAIFGPIVVVLS